MKKFIILFSNLFILQSCTQGKLHNKFVKDAEGNYYQLDWRLGGCYMPQPINKTELDSLSKQ